MNDKVKQVLNGILERFRTGDIPQAVAFSMFPIADTPSARWSLLNRTLMFLAGTNDGRGLKQWNRVNRRVSKGAKAFYILVPFIKKTEDKETGDERQVLMGFMCKPVFRVQDTNGDPLDYEQIEVPVFPLIERAREWGIQVSAISGNYRYAGYYSPSRKEIALATDEESVFFHELSHAAHEKIKNGLKGGQEPFQEIVAELSAQALCKLVGKQPTDHLGNSYKYIEHYATRVKMSPLRACAKVLAEVEQVLELLLKGQENI